MTNSLHIILRLQFRLLSAIHQVVSAVTPNTVQMPEAQVNRMGAAIILCIIAVTIVLYTVPQVMVKFKQTDLEWERLQIEYKQLELKMNHEAKQMELQRDKDAKQFELNKLELEKLNSPEYMEYEKMKMHFELEKKMMDARKDIWGKLMQPKIVKKKTTRKGWFVDEMQEDEVLESPYEKFSDKQMGRIDEQLGISHDGSNRIEYTNSDDTDDEL